MGDEELKRALKLIYQPPKPQGREDFLKGIETPQMTMLEFFLSQVGYICPWGFLPPLCGFCGGSHPRRSGWWPPFCPLRPCPR